MSVRRLAVEHNWILATQKARGDDPRALSFFSSLVCSDAGPSRREVLLPLGSFLRKNVGQILPGCRPCGMSCPFRAATLDAVCMRLPGAVELQRWIQQIDILSMGGPRTGRVRALSARHRAKQPRRSGLRGGSGRAAQAAVPEAKKRILLLFRV